jgi:hypothetical protein
VIYWYYILDWLIFHSIFSHGLTVGYATYWLMPQIPAPLAWPILT